MTRKEIYAKIKQMNLAEKIKSAFGDNYTRVSNADLEAFIIKKEKKATKKPVVNTAVIVNSVVSDTFVRLVSTLQGNKVISKEDADFILGKLFK